MQDELNVLAKTRTRSAVMKFRVKKQAHILIFKKHDAHNNSEN